MMSRLPKTWTQRNQLVYFLMFLAGVLLIMIAYQFIKEGIFFYLAKEVGFALIVAIFLVFTIEKFTREHHQAAADELMEKTHKNLFHAIYKRYIPERVFEEVEKSLMESDVVRSRHELDYTIEARADRPDLVTCTAQTSYELSSVVDAPVTHKIVVRLELPIEEHFHQECSIDELRIGNAVLNAHILARYIVRDAEHCTLSYPMEMTPRGVYQISTRSRLVKKTTDMEVWASRIPSDGLKLTVSTPSKSLEVCASANHSQKLEERLNNGVTKKWDLPFGIFPYQSIIFWWKPRIEEGAATQQAGAPLAPELVLPKEP